MPEDIPAPPAAALPGSDAAGPTPLPGTAGTPPPGGTAGTPVVSILVISYNTKAMTIDCLRSVLAETTVPYELIVLDNASPDGSAAAIAAALPEAETGIRLIASETNHGFAVGNNVASRAATGKYILLLNPDTLVLDQAIDRLVAFAERTPAAGIWGGRTLHGDRTLNPGSVFGRVTLWSLFCRSTGLALLLRRSAFFNPEEMGAWPRDSERDVDVVQGSFFLIRRDLWERLGGFDPTFVMYGEEQDLCLRAAKAGIRPRMTPEATIVHFHGASSKRSSREIMTLKSRVTMIRRHFPAWQQAPAMALLGFWPWSRMASGKALAAVTGRQQFADAAERWGEVWRARGEWRQGYPEVGRS
jgi:GT2 family glycosyltransferase